MTTITKDEVDLEDLAQRMQDLPVELYDMVLEYSFTADEERVGVSWSYKPPARLQVSRATRELFAKKYYSRTRFFLSSQQSIELADCLIESIPFAHVELMDPNLTYFFATGGDEDQVRQMVATDIYLRC